MMRFFRRRRPTLGQRGENLAARHLRRLGFRILERNVRVGRYELDIIARERDTIAFVEVKTRRNEDTVSPVDNVGPEKRQHIRRAARRYIAEHKHPNMYYRFDIVSVVVPQEGKPSLTLYRNAFLDEPESFRRH